MVCPAQGALGKWSFERDFPLNTPQKNLFSRITYRHLALLPHDLDICRAAAPKSMLCPASGVLSGDLPLNTPQKKTLFSYHLPAPGFAT